MRRRSAPSTTVSRSNADPMPPISTMRLGMPSRAAAIIDDPPRISMGAGSVLLRPKARARPSDLRPTSPGALANSAQRVSGVSAVWKSTK